MDLGTMRAYMRDVMEVEAEDWPDNLIDAGLREGYERIAAREQRWPFYEARWTWTTLPGIAGYEVDAIVDGNSRLRELTAVKVDGQLLTFTDERSAEVKWGATDGTPREFSRWADQIVLWPRPADPVVVEARGYRYPLGFQSEAGWEPDMPDEFHALIVDWAMANEYQRQDDIEMMTSYRSKFEEQLASLRKSIMAMPTPGPLVMGGNAITARPWYL